MKEQKNNSIFWGIVLVVVGALFLLDNLGFNISWWKIVKLWPLILIYFGGKEIINYYKNRESKEELKEALKEETKDEEL